MRRELNDAGRSPKYMKNIDVAVKAFLNFHDIKIPPLNPIQENENDEFIDSLPTKDEIKKALSLANPEYQAIILLSSSSGLSAGDIRELTIGDYLEALNIKMDEQLDTHRILELVKEKEEDYIPMYCDKRVKNKQKYCTFSSPESIKAINRYIHKRIDNKDYYNSLKDPLFITVYYVSKAINGEKVTERVTSKIKERTLSTYFKRLYNRCNFKRKVGENENIQIFHCHNLRRWFRSIISEKGGIDSDVAERLIGHKLPKTKRAYAKTDPEHLKEEYMKALPFLTINEPVNLEIMENSEEITRLRLEKDEEISELREKMAGMEEVLKGVLKKQLIGE